MIAPNKPKNCIVPNCANKADGPRGLCQRCYVTARKLVDRKETTWDELQARGLLLPTFRKSFAESPLCVALEASRAKKAKAKSAK